jgi:hypothetical protein
MSSANIISPDPNQAYINQKRNIKGYGIATLAPGIGPVSSNAVAIPYLKSTDALVVNYWYGGEVIGPLSYTYANQGLVNATVTVTSAGNVGQVVAADAVYQLRAYAE